MSRRTKSLFLMGIAAAVVAMLPRIASAEIVAQYSFENNLKDSATGGSTDDNLTYQQGGSMSPSTQYISGVVGQAAVFDGNWFTAADSADNDLSGSTWTIETFLKRDGEAPKWDRLVLKWDNPFSYHFALRDGHLDLFAPGEANPIQTVNTTPATDFGDGDWHHVAVSSDGSATTAWIDGSVVYTGDAITLVDNSSGLGIGNAANNDDASNRFTGWMDEVRLHNSGVDQAYIDGRVALIPEPTSSILAALGLLGLVGLRRRKK